MSRCLQVALMTGLTAISFFPAIFSAAAARAQAVAITKTNDESGRTIWVNGDGPAVAPAKPVAVSSSSLSSAAPGSASSGAVSAVPLPTRSLVYWSVTEHRFKPVPTSGAVMRAARSAASEVNMFFDDKVQSHQALNRAFTQDEIDAAIDEAAARHHVDASLVRSVVKVESNFNPNAVSRKGAMGLMQLMPSTARSLNVSNPFDPAENVDAGVRHLRQLLDNYGGNVRLSLAAYNAGAGAVARSAGVPHFRETQDYVRRITNLYNGGGEPFTRGVSGEGSGNTTRDPVRVERDARGVLHISNTD
jgi:soluble lytic murein transglycosylase-like protein